jgi:hypothetical protein
MLAALVAVAESARAGGGGIVPSLAAQPGPDADQRLAVHEPLKVLALRLGKEQRIQDEALVLLLPFPGPRFVNALVVCSFCLRGRPGGGGWTGCSWRGGSGRAGWPACSCLLQSALLQRGCGSGHDLLGQVRVIDGPGHGDRADEDTEGETASRSAA